MLTVINDRKRNKHSYVLNKIYDSRSLISQQLDNCWWNQRVLVFHEGWVSAAEANELQQEEEQGDDVQIEVESSEHILLRRDCILPVFSTQNKLSIKHQVLQRDRLRRHASALQTLTSEGTVFVWRKRQRRLEESVWRKTRAAFPIFEREDSADNTPYK